MVCNVLVFCVLCCGFFWLCVAVRIKVLKFKGVVLYGFGVLCFAAACSGVQWF